jgi:hypothetical protein
METISLSRRATSVHRDEKEKLSGRGSPNRRVIVISFLFVHVLMLLLLLRGWQASQI